MCLASEPWPGMRRWGGGCGQSCLAGWALHACAERSLTCYPLSLPSVSKGHSLQDLPPEEHSVTTTLLFLVSFQEIKLEAAGPASV